MNLTELNDSQRDAVVYTDGPQLVIAGAGSGKTRVLTYKIAYLLEQGLQPWTILALTFTNKAAKEMKERIVGLVGEGRASGLQMGTFHSIFSRILRVEAAAIGFQGNYTIYDESDSRALLGTIIKEKGFDDTVYKPAAVHNRISMAKNRLSSIDGIRKDGFSDMPRLCDIYAEYKRRLQTANAMDFDDLLVKAFELFNGNEEIRCKWANRFKYILVDEYQDTNYVQQRIITLLTRENHHICVVGDDAQSIYSFRGAEIDNILRFQQTYTDAKLFKLERNYRSTQCIVNAANSLIRHNSRQIFKNVYSEKEQGMPLRLRESMSDREEAAIVCSEIRRLKREEHQKWSDSAILYRTNAQSRSFEEELRRHSMPYRIYGGLSFYQRKEIKDIIAYFRLVINPDDEEAFIRVINYPSRGIGATTVNRLKEAARNAGCSLWHILTNGDVAAAGISKTTASKLQDFHNLIVSFRSRLANEDACTLGQSIIKDTGILAEIYSSSEEEYIVKQENLQELLSSLNGFVSERRETSTEHQDTLVDFLQEVSLMSDLDSDGSCDDRVVLMTVHAAKGLEFPNVFVVGLEENIFPSIKSIDSLRGIEEERRLLYVAITRAQKHCMLTYAKSRYRYGKLEYGNPSRFIGELDRKLIDANFMQTGYVSTRRSNYGQNTSYMGKRWGDESHRPLNGEMQNSRPVASQFRADPQPKITSQRQHEAPIDSLLPSFRRMLEGQSTGIRRLHRIPATSNPNTRQETNTPLVPGNRIEHNRFGRGTVVAIEGSGENTKATIKFEYVGLKVLLLKYSKYRLL